MLLDFKDERLVAFLCFQTSNLGLLNLIGKISFLNFVNSFLLPFLKLINNLKISKMAKNAPLGESRDGVVTRRSHNKNPKIGLCTKRDTETGGFLNVKSSSPELFKQVRKEN